LDKEVLNATISLDSLVSQLLYDELFFRYKQAVGSCSKWNQFRKSREIGRFLSIRNIESISILTIKQLYDYYEILDGTPETVECANGTLAKQIVRRLSGETSANMSISCGGYEWKIRNCYNSIPALCIGCEDPCTEHCSNERYVNFISPCRAPEICMDSARNKRNGIINSIHMLSVTSTDRFPAPTIQNMTVSSTKNEAVVSLKLAGPGGANCAAFTAGTVVSNLDIVRFQNKIGIANTSETSITLSGLAPATRYTMYCFSFSSTGSALSYKQMIAQGVRNFTTSCCKTVEVAFASAYVVESRNYAGFLTVNLDSLPSAALTVTVTAVFNGTTSHSFFPTSLQFAVNSASSSGIQSLSTKGMKPGDYSLQVTLQGTSHAEFSSVFAQNISTFTVLSRLVAPPAPKLLAAAFSKTGSFVTVTFDSATDQAGLSVPFTCSHLLTFSYANMSTCLWTGTANVLVYPYYKRQLLTYTGLAEYNQQSSKVVALRTGSLVTLLASKLKAQCTVTSCTSWAYAASASIRVLPSAAGTSPSLTISSPLILGTCDHLVLDLTSSSNDGGRNWQNLTVVVDSKFASAFSLKQIQAFLQTDYVLVPPTPIPRSMFDNNAEYSFYYSSCNFYGVCSTAVQKVTVLPAVVPIVSMIGSPSRDVYRYDLLTIDADASVQSECNSTSTKRALLYSWAVRRENVVVRSLPSESNNPATFRLSPFKLDAGGMYYVYVTVADSTTGYAASNFVRINVLRGNLVGAIAGASVFDLGVGEVVTLDAGKSYDQDFGPTVALPLSTTFTWSCVTISPNYTTTCGMAFDSAVIERKNAFTGSVTDAISVVTVTVVDAFGRQAQASVTITVVDAVLSRIVLSTVAPYLKYSTTRRSFVMNPSASLVLQGKVDLTESESGRKAERVIPARWSVDDTSLDLSKFALTAVTTDISPFVGVKPVAMNLVLQANALSASRLYTFSFSVLSKRTSIQVTINSAPLPGSFSTSPSSGTEFSTLFDLICFLWQDEDLPLSYSFGYQSTASGVVSLSPRSEFAYAKSMLPCISTNSTRSKIALVATVYDSLDGNSSATSSVIVSRNITARASAVAANIARALASSQGDNRKLTQLISVAGGMINSADCSGAPSKCGKLYNRNPCAFTDNTCGSCLKGYAGVVGDANSVCVSISASKSRRLDMRVAANITCDRNSDCKDIAFATCVDKYCVVPSKSCLYGCSSVGNCTFVNTHTNFAVDECLMDDPLCQPSCSCEEGYYGLGCQYDAETYALKADTRQLLLSTLLNQSEFADATIDTVTSWIGTMELLSRRFDQLTDTALDRLYAMLSTTVYNAAQADIPTTSLLSLTESVDALMQGLGLLSTDAVTGAQLSSLMESFGLLLSSSQQLGQEKLDLITSEIRMTAGVTQIVNPESSYAAETETSTSIPQSDLEIYAELIPTQFSVPVVAGTSARGYSTVRYMLKSKFFGKYGWYSNLLGFDYTSLDGTDLQVSCSSSGCEVELIIQYNQFIDRIDPWEEITHTQCYDRDFYAQNYSCRTNPGHNITVQCPGLPGLIIDRCPIRNVTTVCLNAANAHSRLGHCDVRHVTDSNVTCICSIKDDGVFEGLSGSRRLSSDGNLTFSSVSAKYSSGEFIRTLKYNQNFHPNSDSTTFEQSTLVLLSLFAFGGLMIILSFVSYGRDHVGEEAVKKAVQKRNLRLKALAEKSEEPKKSIMFEEAGDESKDADRVYAFEEESKTTKGDAVDERKFYPLVPGASSLRGMWKAVETATLNLALPPIFRLGGLREKLVGEFFVYHRWLNILAHRSDYYSRLMRVFALGAQILCAAALQAAMYTFTDPDDGKCVDFTDERRCIAQSSDYVDNHSKCIWALSSHTCHFRQPHVSYQMIMIVAGLSAAMSVPIARVLEFIVIKFSIPPAPAASVTALMASPRLKSGGDGGSAASKLEAAFAWSNYLNPRRLVSNNRVIPTDNDQSTPAVIRKAVFSFGGDEPSRQVVPFNVNRIRCISFINALPLEVEIENMQRRLKSHADSLTFLGSLKDRTKLLRKLSVFSHIMFSST
jgi:hypothetical protein